MGSLLRGPMRSMVTLWKGSSVIGRSLLAAYTDFVLIAPSGRSHVGQYSTASVSPLLATATPSCASVSPPPGCPSTLEMTPTPLYSSLLVGGPENPLSGGLTAAACSQGPTDLPGLGWGGNFPPDCQGRWGFFLFSGRVGHGSGQVSGLFRSLHVHTRV